MKQAIDHVTKALQVRQGVGSLLLALGARACRPCLRSSSN
jgi:hypothetical protein